MEATFSDEEYEQMAIQSIKEYKNKDYTDDQIKTLYPLAIPLVIKNIKDSLVIDKSVVEKKQGDRDTTYRENIIIIDDAVKLLIGRPYVRMW